MLRKQKEYLEQVLPKLKEEFNYKSDLEVPRLQKIVLSRGVSVEQSKIGNNLEDLTKDLTNLACQKAVVTLAKKSIAAFKLREGMPNGMMVTLRRDRMYAFFDRFVSVAAPRIRDFRGFNIKGDGFGNFTLGFEDQGIFPELENRSSKGGMKITLVTSAKTDQEGKALLTALGFPFSKN